MSDPVPTHLPNREVVNPKEPEITSDPGRVKSMVEGYRRCSGNVYYEIGFGGRFSTNLSEGDISVGVDPMRGMTPKDIIDIDQLEDAENSGRLVFNGKIDLLPKLLYPDVVIMIAPSPESYEEMMDELETIVGPKTQFLIAIERQSSQGSQSLVVMQMIEEISGRFKDWGCRLIIDYDSEDLGDEFGDLLEEVGVKTGGVLNTSPWLPEGSWATVLGVR